MRRFVSDYFGNITSFEVYLQIPRCLCPSGRRNLSIGKGPTWGRAPSRAPSRAERAAPPAGRGRGEGGAHVHDDVN